MLPEAKMATTNPGLYFNALKILVDVLLALDRWHEAHEMATEWVAFAKGKFGLDDPLTLGAVRTYATACVMIGRVEEAKATFEAGLSTETRILGREHPDTQTTRDLMYRLGFAVSSG